MSPRTLAALAVGFVLLGLGAAMLGVVDAANARPPVRLMLAALFVLIGGVLGSFARRSGPF